MQWWMRPGPSRSWASANPAPRAPTSASSPTRTPSNRTSAWLAQSLPASPMILMLRTSV
jgi:hypothetical protein